jgi:hypothetical protein
LDERPKVVVLVRAKQEAVNSLRILLRPQAKPIYVDDLFNVLNLIHVIRPSKLTFTVGSRGERMRANRLLDCGVRWLNVLRPQQLTFQHDAIPN